MSEYKVKCISARTGIKSSLGEHVQSIVTSYILWVSFSKPYHLDYSEEYQDTDGDGNSVTKARFIDKAKSNICNYLSKSDIPALADNVLCTAQLEPLQTGTLNVYKAAYFSFLDGELGESSERSGGKRFAKRIYFTALIDLFHSLVQANEQDFKRYAYLVISKGDYKSDPFHQIYGSFWSPIVDITKFKTADDLEVDNLTSASSKSFHQNGTARILKAFLSEGLHPYLEHTKQAPGEPNSINKANTESDEYCKRSSLLSSILKPNYCKEDTQTAHIEEERENYLADIKIDRHKENHSQLPLPLNILFSGVPGTGKSFVIKEIIEKHFKFQIRDSLGKRIDNVLKINVHSETKNSSLMQGISVGLSAGNIFYSEKRGAILDLIIKAVLNPAYPFLVVLEEIQENSLNLLIGDLIYLIEEDKRVDLTEYESGNYDSAWSLIDGLVEELNADYVSLPSLVSEEPTKRLVLPNNLYFICTANHRDDKKIIEDNLLRRFEFIEVYPNTSVIEDDEVKAFLEGLNNNIVNHFQHIESEQLLIGHAVWMHVKDEEAFWRAFSKLLTDMRKVKQLDFDDIKAVLKGLNAPFQIQIDFASFNDYREMSQYVQSRCGYSFLG